MNFVVNTNLAFLANVNFPDLSIAFHLFPSIFKRLKSARKTNEINKIGDDNDNGGKVTSILINS